MESSSGTIGDVATDTPPVLAEIGAQTIEEGQELVLGIVSATDADADPITLTVSPLPAGAGFVIMKMVPEFLPGPPDLIRLMIIW